MYKKDLKIRKRYLIGICLFGLIIPCCSNTQVSSIFSSNSSKESFVSLSESSSEISSSNLEESSSSISSISDNSSEYISNSESDSSESSSSSIESSSSDSSENNIYQLEKDYKIFSVAPEIRFKTQASTSFATAPTRESEKPEVSGEFETTNCPSEYALSGVKGAMRVRGNYTSNYEKKPFRIKFEEKTNLFGLNNGREYRKWILLADVKDTSMLRNALAFYLGRNMFDSNVFVSDFTPVHLYINDQYWGLYLLCEQKEVNTNRVDIYEPSEDYDGVDIGYFFELDHYYQEEARKSDGHPTFTVNYRPMNPNQHHLGENYARVERGYTIASDITNADTQIPYLKNRVEMIYEILFNACSFNTLYEIENEQLIKSKETDIEKALEKTIDIDSFVNMYILSEIVCDPDIGYSSFYLSLDMSSKGNKLLTLNCPWDFDSSLGVRKNTVEDSKGMYAASCSNPWLYLLTKQQFFMNKVKEKWKQLVEDDLFNNSISMIDTYSSLYKNEYKNNFKKWPKTMGNNYEVSSEIRDICKTFRSEQEAENLLKTWFSKRISYLDSQFNK